MVEIIDMHLVWETISLPKPSDDSKSQLSKSRQENLRQLSISVYSDLKPKYSASSQNSQEGSESEGNDDQEMIMMLCATAKEYLVYDE